jgi:hypothetical protein
MRHTIKAPQAVERVYEARDEAYDIVLPSGLIDPGPKNESGRSMGRCLYSNYNHDDKPSNLKIENWKDLLVYRFI